MKGTTMPNKKIEKSWEMVRGVDARFPKKLTAEAICRLKTARETAVTEDEKAEAEYAWRKFVEAVVCAAGDYADYVGKSLVFAKRRRLTARRPLSFPPFRPR